MKKLLLVIIGLPGSGKTTIANFLALKFHAAVFHSGNMIREEIKKRGLAYTPENDIRVANFFHTRGRDILISDRTWKKISRIKSKIIIAEGFRNLKQHARLRALNEKQNKFSRIVLVSVSASFKIRTQRELARRRFSKGETLSYICNRDKIETKHGLKKLIAQAEYKIDTSGSLKETKIRASMLMKKILQI